MNKVSQNQFTDESFVAEEPIGDLIRGERYTLGYSIEDVQNRLKIKPEIIEAIENSDLDSIGRPQFIVGYIRSYSALLGLDPELVLSEFEKQCGLVRAKPHQQNIQKSSVAGYQFSKPRKDWGDRIQNITRTTSLALPIVVVLGLVGAGVYGSAKFINGFQTLQVVPTETRPTALTQNQNTDISQSAAVPAEEYPAINYDELYQRQALQTPVVTPRTGRIADVDITQVGVFAQNTPPTVIQEDAPEIQTAIGTSEPVVTVGPSIPEIELIPMGESWVRLTNEDGEVLFEKLLQAGEVLDVPVEGFVPVLRKAGNANQLYVKVNNSFYGPIGIDGATIVNNVPLTPEAISTSFESVPDETILELQEKTKSYLAKVEG